MQQEKTQNESETRLMSHKSHMRSVINEVK